MRLIVLLLMFASCASAVLPILKLKDRRLMVCKDKPGLCWPHQVCTRKNWYSKKKCQQKDGFIDLTVQKNRNLLRNMGFTATSKMRFK